MSLEEYLSAYEDTNLLRRFAFTGRKDSFNKKLLYLERIAEHEKWRFRDSSAVDGEMNVLFYYIVHTFDRCFTQGKISVGTDETTAAFNTGLLTDAGEQILGVFTLFDHYNENDPLSNYWYLYGFYRESDRYFLDTGLDIPEMATYFEDYGELYFDPELEISPNYNHILDDNRDRLPPELQQMDKPTAAAVLDGFVSHAIKRIRRNSRIPVPQYYNGRIMFLIPLKAFGDEPIVLAVEKYEGKYRANTILTLNMAYNCARLLTKPESNWLLPH